MENVAPIVETQNVVIAEPSQESEELLHSEKPCFTKKHLYIAIGVVFVVAISLIGSLLDFSPAVDQVTEQSIREGTEATFPEFDTNGDGYIDRAEFTAWTVERISHDVNSNTTGGDAVPTSTEIDQHFSPVDLNKDGRVTRDEAVAFAIRVLEAIGRAFRGRRSSEDTVMSAPAAIKSQDACPVPAGDGFSGRRRGGFVGACRKDARLWCYSSPFCHHRHKCHRFVIPQEYQVTDTCCGTSTAANCTQCSCGSSYNFVPEGCQARIRNYCHVLARYYCDATDTGVTASSFRCK
jgi:hypothetical protein